MPPRPHWLLLLHHWFLHLLQYLQYPCLSMIPIFCVEFWELSHLTSDLSQAEKKINVVASWANAQTDIYFSQNVFLLIKNPINRLRLHQLLGTKTTGGPPLTRKSLTRSKAIETCMISLIMDIKKILLCILRPINFGVKRAYCTGVNILFWHFLTCGARQQ